MTTTPPPMPKKPTGKLAFALQTITNMEQRITALEAAIERKDALLRQALEVLSLNQSAHPVAYRNAREAITKELQ